MNPVTLQPITSRLFSSHILEINNIYLMKNWDNVPRYLFMACTNAISAVGLDTDRALYRHEYLHAPSGQPSIHRDYKKWPPFYRWHFQLHFPTENLFIEIKISMKSILGVLINNKSALGYLLAWCQTGFGAKPLPEPMIYMYVLPGQTS